MIDSYHPLRPEQVMGQKALPSRIPPPITSKHHILGDEFWADASQDQTPDQTPIAKTEIPYALEVFARRYNQTPLQMASILANEVQRWLSRCK